MAAVPGGRRVRPWFAPRPSIRRSALSTTASAGPVFRRAAFALGCILVAASACQPGTLLQNTTSLGGDVPGDRGTVRMLFINHTPFRAVFTYGTYDPLYGEFPPQFNQFVVDADPANRLEGNSESEILTLTCARVVSVGGQELIDRIESGHLSGNADLQALRPGIAFSDRPLDDPNAGEPVAGATEGVTSRLGVDFQCESLLIYTFEVDATQPSGFRIDLEVILP